MKTEDCRSVIQDDFEEALTWEGHCIHHVFPGPFRKKCEKYGFLVCINARFHTMIHRNMNGGFALEYKMKCQRYYEEHYGTREDFIREFGRNHL